MVIFRVVASYFTWHYTVAFRQIFEVWTNFLWYVAHLFSLGVLIRTLFSPWKRMDEHYSGGFNLERFFEVAVVNTLSRVVGFVIKVPIICIGLIMILVMCIGLVALYICWVFLPTIISAMVVTGFSYLYVS